MKPHSRRIWKLLWPPCGIEAGSVWNDSLEWLPLTTPLVERLDQALDLIPGDSQPREVEEFHKAWKTGCRAEQRQLEEADRLCRCSGHWPSSPPAFCACAMLPGATAAPRAAAPETTIQILAAKLQQPAEGFTTTNRDFLRGVARLGGFLARKADSLPSRRCYGMHTVCWDFIFIRF